MTELDREAQKMAERLREKIISLLPQSTGKLIESINPIISKEGELIDITIEGESYYKYVDKGRMKGTFPELKALEEWAKTRGIDEKYVYVIGRSIQNRGIKPRNITERVEKETGDVGDKFMNALSRDLDKELNDKINRAIK